MLLSNKKNKKKLSFFTGRPLVNQRNRGEVLMLESFLFRLRKDTGSRIGMDSVVLWTYIWIRFS